MITANSCFESDCSCQSARIHLPVADLCNANCYYCSFRTSRNISLQAMPGHSLFIPRGHLQIEQYLNKRMKLMPECSLIGISGPGDILSSTEQLCELLEVVSNPQYLKIACCICTNGWDFYLTRPLMEQWDTLKYITVTINSLQPQECAHIYVHPTADEAYYNQKKAAQLALLHWAADRNITLKINTVLSEYNAESILDTWEALSNHAPIHIYNLLQLQGQTMTSDQKVNYNAIYRKVLVHAQEAGFRVKNNCKHCRADSYGRW